MKMTQEERELYCYLLDSPLVVEGTCPEWYTTLSVASRLRIAPWLFSGEEATDEVRDYWKEKTLIALEVEFWVEETKRKMPTLFKESFDPSTLIINLLKKENRTKFNTVGDSGLLD